MADTNNNVYHLKQGDNVWNFVSSKLKSKCRNNANIKEGVNAIFDTNKHLGGLGNANRLAVNTEIDFSCLADNENYDFSGDTISITGSNSDAAAKASQSSSAAGQKGTAEKIEYEIKSGDTLYKIVSKHLGKTDKKSILAGIDAVIRANQGNPAIKSKDLIYASTANKTYTIDLSGLGKPAETPVKTETPAPQKKPAQPTQPETTNTQLKTTETPAPQKKPAQPTQPETTNTQLKTTTTPAPTRVEIETPDVTVSDNPTPAQETPNQTETHEKTEAEISSLAKKLQDALKVEIKVDDDNVENFSSEVSNPEKIKDIILGEQLSDEDFASVILTFDNNNKGNGLIEQLRNAGNNGLTDANELQVKIGERLAKEAKKGDKAAIEALCRELHSATIGYGNLITPANDFINKVFEVIDDDAKLKKIGHQYEILYPKNKFGNDMRSRTVTHQRIRNRMFKLYGEVKSASYRDQ